MFTISPKFCPHQEGWTPPPKKGGRGYYIVLFRTAKFENKGSSSERFLVDEEKTPKLNPL